MNEELIYNYVSHEKGTFAERITNKQVGKRAQIWKKYGKEMTADVELLLHQFIVSKGDNSDQVQNVKYGAYMLLNFLKGCYSSENQKKVLEEKKTAKLSIKDGQTS